MLSIRQTTCNDLVFLETGQANVKQIILDRQTKFLRKMKTRNNYVMDIVNLAIITGSPMGKRMANLINLDISQRSLFMKSLKESVEKSVSSRRITYKELNPHLEPSKVLNMCEIREPDRIAMTRMRLGSHKLKVETGRWARIPKDLRTCPCNTGVQNEHHVLLTCPMSQNLRKKFHLENFNNMAELFQHDTKDMAEYCNHVLNLYQT